MTTRRLGLRLRRLVGAAALVSSLATIASACGASASTLGHEACLDVRRSLSLYARSTKTTDQALAASERARAESLLRKALQPAAIAGSNDGDWQALMTTLSESNRVPESKLVSALSAQCAQSLSKD
ncbi:MAG: hypothetical protein WB770_06380 [Acidimicrobiales bacterium]